METENKLGDYRGYGTREEFFLNVGDVTTWFCANSDIRWDRGNLDQTLEVVVTSA